MPQIYFHPAKTIPTLSQKQNQSLEMSESIKFQISEIEILQFYYSIACFEVHPIWIPRLEEPVTIEMKNR